MQYRLLPYRSARLTGAGALLLAAAIAAATADAHATPGPSADAGMSVASAGALGATLGDASQGMYYDAGRRQLVVDVLDDSAADSVRAKGAEPRLVQNSLADLRAATDTLSSKASVPGTAWAIDPKLNKVVVTADRTVSAARLATVRTVVDGLGQKAVLRRSKAAFTLLASGGDAIWGSDVRCSLGFNVVKDGKPYFLTAGHCGNAAKSWSDSQGGAEIGTTQQSEFPGNDFALVEYTADTAHPSEVNLYNGSTRQIAQAGAAMVGESVERSGSTSELHSGDVTGLDATVNYQEGTVEGLIQTNVCAEPGDSGGPLFDGSTALGLTSGGSGDCTSGGETFFQPVPEALQTLGAQIG